jgi:hypothetical protein
VRVRESGRDLPYLFSLEECQVMASTAGRSFIMCYSGGINPVRLDTIVPDIAMVHLEDHRVEHSELVQEEEIGQGGYATVYKGRLKDETVAIKVLNFQLASDDDFLSYAPPPQDTPHTHTTHTHSGCLTGRFTAQGAREAGHLPQDLRGVPARGLDHEVPPYTPTIYSVICRR